MDVASGTTNVPVSRKTLGLVCAVLALLFLGDVGSAWAITENKPLHYSADKQVWDRKANRVELFGHAKVNQPGESISADYIVLDLNTRDVDARGNCVYIASDSVIFGEEMHFNLENRTGTIVGGRVTNDKFSLVGERINKLGDGRFQTHWGEYSTCRDCPQSWSFQSEDVDMQIEGYAHMSNVTVKVKDAPAFWFPYLIVPMKTQRQTGFLFPRFGFSSQTGGIFVLPFFWAISRSADMTFSIGEFTNRGRRMEWEGRYSLSSRSNGQANFNYLSDRTFAAQRNRWGLGIEQTQELPLGIEQKLKFQEVSDNEYPQYGFVRDVARGTEQYLNSNLIFSYGSSSFSAYVVGTRTRNLFNTDPDATRRKLDFDPTTVQAVPSAVVTTNDKLFFDGSLASGLTVGVTNFTRTGTGYDIDPNVASPFDPTTGEVSSGARIIRKATRFSLTPTAYTTIRPFDVFSVVPSVQYRQFFYNFHDPAVGNSLSRGYLLFQIDLSTQLEKIYDSDNPEIPRQKHLIRPILTYSRIPYHTKSTHPFISQLREMDRLDNVPRYGYQFDNYDIVPIDTSPANYKYFTPLGNSLTYGLTSQLIRRKGAIDSRDATYQRTIEFSAGQSINFREFRLDPGIRRPLSRFFSNLTFTFDKVGSTTNYSYTPYIGGFRHQMSTSLDLIIERTLHQRILTFDRSLSLAYNLDRLGCLPGQDCDRSSVSSMINYSLNDYILPSVSATFLLGQHKFSNAMGRLIFQSPSQCWRFETKVGYIVFSAERRETQFGFDLSLNLDGSGFGGFGDATRTQSMGAR